MMLAFDVKKYYRYCIISNKSLEYLHKSFWVSAYLFHYLLQGLTQKLMILAILRLIASHIELEE